MSGYLMDFLVGRIRNMAYDTILKAYAPSVPISYIAIALGFKTNNNHEEEDPEDHEEEGGGSAAAGEDECLRFIKLNKGVLNDNDPLSLDTKKSKAAKL
jgi:hypothetical protein